MNDPLTLGRAVRQEMARLLTPDALVDRGFPRVVTPALAARGTLSDLSWIETAGIGAHADALPPILAQPSELLDALFGAVWQALHHYPRVVADPVAPGLAPVVVQHGRHGTRIGVLTWATDRDAFIEELLGRPVPRSPRYATQLPEIPAQFSGDVEAVQASLGFGIRDRSALYGEGRAQAIQHLYQLMPVIDRAATDQSAAALLHLLAEREPRAVVDSPLGRILLPVARAAPRWRTPNIRPELAASFDLGGMVRRLAVVVWPRVASMRSNRRQMAAYLRRLFDHGIAPWASRRDPRNRRELILLYFRAGWPAVDIGPRTVKDTAAALRRHHPAAYVDETPAQTLKRLYHFSAGLRTMDGRAGRRKPGATITSA